MWVNQIFDLYLKFCANEVYVFQGIMLKVQLFFDGQVSHSMGVHCIVHNVNLAMKTLSCLLMMNILEGLWYPMFYIYFKKSLKGQMEFSKLVKIVETKGVNFWKSWRWGENSLDIYDVPN